jgi:hypothetical protein
MVRGDVRTGVTVIGIGVTVTVLVAESTTNPVDGDVNVKE